MPYTSTSSQHSQHWSFAMQSQHYLCVLVPFSPRYSISLVHVPTPQRGELLLWLLCQLQWQSERQVSKGNARGATDTDGCFRAQPGTACSPPSFSGNSRHACLSSFVCAKNILVWCWFESTLQMCAKFAIMIFLTVLKKNTALWMLVSYRQQHLWA